MEMVFMCHMVTHGGPGKGEHPERPPSGAWYTTGVERDPGRTASLGPRGSAWPGPLTLAALLAVALGGESPRPDWKTPLERAGIRFVSAREVHAMMGRAERFVLVDARDEIHYRRGHLPGAISIPAEDQPLRLVDIRRPRRLLHPERLPDDRATPIVFYCGGLN
jgi:rhodanese-related sulfurtransferase